MAMRLRVLVDRNLESHALTAEGAIQSQTLNWGPYTITGDVHGYRAKKLPTSKWLRQQIESLPTLARLVAENKLAFCTSSEIRFEAFNAAPGCQGSAGDLFRSIDYEHVPSAVERSYFWKTIDTGVYASGEGQVNWYKRFLLKVDEHQLLEQLRDYDALPEFDKENLSNLSRLRDICKYLDTEDHIRDAFHLWTAEVNGLDYFLTADKRFINKMTLSTPLDLPTPPISPASLVDICGIKELDPMPIASGRFYSQFESD